MCTTGPIPTLTGFSALVLLSCVLLSPVATVAQRQGGALGGIVRGAEGAPAAGVHVRLGMLSKVPYNSTTDRTGQYRFANLPPGSYEMTFSAPGFVTQVWTGIWLAEGANRVLNVLMRVGDPAQIVRLAAPSAAVAQSSGAIAGNIGLPPCAIRPSTDATGRNWQHCKPVLQACRREMPTEPGMPTVGLGRQ